MGTSGGRCREAPTAYCGGVDGGASESTVALVALLAATKRQWSEVRADLDEQEPLTLLRSEVHADLLTDAVGIAIDRARAQIENWERDGIRLTSPYESDYPDQLRTVHDYPPILFLRGARAANDIDSVAVVGTRQPSAGALAFIREVVPLIAADGHPVVSGLALGVDAAAMRASLEVGNRTIGIIGTGINRSYPAPNKDLQAEIARSHLLISQFWPDAPPTRTSFPMRNHVMSAFSSMTLIVEAGEHSGTRIQARAATRHARPLIITRAVQQQTQWAKDLIAQQFDVRVVGSAAETIDAIRAIRARDGSDPEWEMGSLSSALI